MEQERGAGASASSKQPPSRTPRPESDRISTARKIRLALLLCVLVAVVVAAVIINRRQQRELKQLREDLSTAVQLMRESVQGLDPDSAQDELTLNKAQGVHAWEVARQLAAELEGAGEPEEANAKLAEARRLAVALYYADASLDEAIGLFNELDTKKIAEELDPAQLQMAQRAVSAFPPLAVEAAGSEIYGDGRIYLNDCAVLWQIAWRTCSQAETGTEKALRLCRWCALHLLPVEQDAPPAMPAMVVLQGYGSPAQIAWTYADMARQVGLSADAVILRHEGASQQCLMQVRPPDGEPFLVIPSLGVPVVDAETNELLSLESLAERPEAYAALMALAGRDAPYTAEDFREAEVKIAVHPYALFPRFLVLAHLLSALPSAPRVALEVDPAGSSPSSAIWELPVQTLQRLRMPGAGSDKQRALLQMVPDPRLRQMRGFYDSADVEYRGLTRSLRGKLASTDVKDAAAALRDMIETVEFFAASNLHDACAWPLAEKRLRDHLEAYPSGQWATMVRALLAETLSASGKGEEAAQLWKELEQPRKLYGALRLRGLLPPAPLYEVSPVGLPQGSESDSDSS